MVVVVVLVDIRLSHTFLLVCWCSEAAHHVLDEDVVLPPPSLQNISNIDTSECVNTVGHVCVCVLSPATPRTRLENVPTSQRYLSIVNGDGQGSGGCVCV